MDKKISQEYRVLARKYRPQKFSDLIGQDTLVKALTNAILKNRIAHAYLLSGARGIGKTTTARLIAMSLNCETRLENSFEPCGECNSCKSIREDRNLDVIEMDAASKTGVDDVREIIDNVKYKPINSKYKIFIIDEVHMLSKNAFNALLKTLEEPPPHIKFIFATTEVKKIPITIISRCQQFDLHLIKTENLILHIENIIKIEKILIEKEALPLIVRAAAGSVRDGLSILDQAISIDHEKITAKSVSQMLSLADRGDILDLFEKIFKGETILALQTYNKLYKSGADVIMIFDELLKVTHFITQLKIVPNLKDDIFIPEQERLKGFEISQKISMPSLGVIWQVLFKGYEELQKGYHLFLHGEMLIIRLIYIYKGPSPDDLIKDIKLDQNFLNSKNNETQKKNSIEKNYLVNEKENIEKITLQEKDLSKNSENKILNNVKNSKSSIQIMSFRHFVDLFYLKKEGMLHTYLYNSVKLVSFKEGEVVINIDNVSEPNFIRTIAKYISTWTGRIWQISSSTSNIGNTLYEEDLINNQKEIEIMKNDIEVKNILINYPKTKIHSITNIGETSDDFKKDNSNKIIKEK